MGGRFDDILAALPPEATQSPAVGAPQNRGKYDDILSGITPPKQSLKDQVKGAYRIATDIVPEVAPSPTQRIQKGLDIGGEKLAEALGKHGYPKLGALYGTEIQTLPAILGAATGIGALETSEAPLAQAVRNSPRMLSPRYDAVKEAAGISKDLPISRGTIPKFPGLNGLPSNVPPPEAPMVAPKIYPKEINGLLNFVRARVEGLGSKLSGQELEDYHSIINTAMRDGKIAPGTPPYAVATKLLKDFVNPLRSKAIPGIADTDQIYALSKKLRIAPEVAKTIWNYVGPKMRWGAGIVGGQ